jgi:hypothetical protein
LLLYNGGIIYNICRTEIENLNKTFSGPPPPRFPQLDVENAKNA